MAGFTAIDVETANADFASICQIGIVRFEDGTVAEEWQSLVNPEDEFDGMNISIHGITEDLVASSPTLPELFDAVSAKLRDGIVVCHTAFDRVSIRQACERYRLSIPAINWLDSARVARRAWPDRCGTRGYGLRKLAEMLSLTFNAHVAVEDARVAGEVVLLAMADTGLTLSDWLKRVNGPIFASSIAQEGNSEGPLAGNGVVFTGTLSMVRAKAAAMAANAGCDVHQSVRSATTLLVVGDQDIRKLGGQEKSVKHRKAEALILGGQQIRIICESDFRRLLTAESVPGKIEEILAKPNSRRG